MLPDTRCAPPLDAALRGHPGGHERRASVHRQADRRPSAATSRATCGPRGLDADNGAASGAAETTSRCFFFCFAFASRPHGRRQIADGRPRRPRRRASPPRRRAAAASSRFARRRFGLLLEDAAHGPAVFLNSGADVVDAKPVIAVQQPAEAVIFRVELEPRTILPLREQGVALALALALELRLAPSVSARTNLDAS